MKALRLSGALADAPARLELGSDPGAALRSAQAEPHPVVLLLPEDELGGLDGCRELIVDRGRKHAAKPLAPLLLGQPRIPLVRGSYTSPGQLLRSVRTLLDRAGARREHKLFLVSADPATFAALWARTPEPAPRPHPDSGATPPLAPAGLRAVLFELLPELAVPAAVQERFIGGSAETRLVVQLLLRAARQDQPVLILGDTGTGKEVVARLIHDQSARRHQSFTAVNCGAIPRELLESELFGYERGAHSTATSRKMGLWQRAHGGTLFLDEIADLSLDHQVKLFRALEHGEIRPVGAEREIKVDARVIAATNRNLFAMMQAAEFREDLYYRLRAFMIRTPALRDHPEDIPALAGYFWRQITLDQAAGLPAALLDDLTRYRWPGNAREMRMVLASLFGLFGNDRLEPRHLHAVFAFEGQAVGGPPAPPASDLAAHRVECVRQLRRADESLRAAQVALRPLTRPSAGPPGGQAEPLERRFSELELLCLQPALFHGDAPFRAVRRLKDRLREVALHLRAGDPAGAAAGCRGVDEEFDQARGLILKEIEKLLGSTR